MSGVGEYDCLARNTFWELAPTHYSRPRTLSDSVLGQDSLRLAKNNPDAMSDLSVGSTEASLSPRRSSSTSSSDVSDIDEAIVEVDSLEVVDLEDCQPGPVHAFSEKSSEQTLERAQVAAFARCNEAPEAASMRIGAETSYAGKLAIRLRRPKEVCSWQPPRHPEAGRKSTVMMQNLPGQLSRDDLIQMLNARGFIGQFSFMYMPLDLSSLSVLGYAFIDFISPQVARVFWKTFDGFSDWPQPSQKVCAMSWSEPIQGLNANIDRYRNSPLFHRSVVDAARPVLFRNGVRVQFPPPTKSIRAPRCRPSHHAWRKEERLPE